MKALCIALTALAVLVRSQLAFAREAPAIHDDDEDDVTDLADEALGARGTLRTRAETVSFDARQRTIELSGNVRVDAPPFHLRSKQIRLTRTKYGIEIDGKGRLAFCPCLGTPLTVEFEKAIVAPPGDLILKSPTLEFYGVPFFYLPWFWMRSDEKIGVLPPEIAYRGQDGLFLGEGVHLPWKRHGGRHSLDLRGGAYLVRGFVADARLRTPSSTTKIRYDRLPGGTAPLLPVPGSSADTEGDDGLLVDARGAVTDGALATAWDADVLRGRRGVAATTDLDAAAKPWDRASIDGALRSGPLLVSTGVRAVTRRGGGIIDVESAGPVAAVRASGAIASGITYDATVEGGALRVSGTAASLAAIQPPSITPDTVSFARGEAGLSMATALGPVSASLGLRGAANVAAEGRRDGGDRAGTARLRFGLPLARRFEAPAVADAPPSDDARDPWMHVIEPFIEASLLGSTGDNVLGSLPGRALGTIDGTAPITDAGFVTTLGRWASKQAIELRVTGGAAYGSSVVASGVRPLARARLAATLDWLGASADTAHVSGDGDDRPGAPSSSGAVFVARTRLGREAGPRLLANVATREGLDPVLARALSDAPLEPPAGFLLREGATGGATLVLPWSRALTTTVGADADATNQEIVGARGGFELRDRCGCVTLRANGSHRIGRNGVDVWIAIDFAADR